MVKCKKTAVIIIVLFSFVLSSFSGCSKEETPEETSNVSFGYFNEERNIYTNEWLGIKFTLPADMTALSVDELKLLVGEEAGVIINDGTVTNEDISASEYGAYFDFALYDSQGICAVKLMYEDTLKTSASILSPENYLLNLRSQTEKNKNFSYDVEDLAKVLIAGKEYYLLEINVTEFIKADYYVTQLDDILIILTTITYTEQSPDINMFIDSIEEK